MPNAQHTSKLAQTVLYLGETLIRRMAFHIMLSMRGVSAQQIISLDDSCKDNAKYCRLVGCTWHRLGMRLQALLQMWALSASQGCRSSSPTCPVPPRTTVSRFGSTYLSSSSKKASCSLLNLAAGNAKTG